MSASGKWVGHLWDYESIRSFDPALCSKGIRESVPHNAFCHWPTTVRYDSSGRDTDLPTGWAKGFKQIAGKDLPVFVGPSGQTVFQGDLAHEAQKSAKDARLCEGPPLRQWAETVPRDWKLCWRIVRDQPRLCYVCPQEWSPEKVGDAEFFGRAPQLSEARTDRSLETVEASAQELVIKQEPSPDDMDDEPLVTRRPSRPGGVLKKHVKIKAQSTGAELSRDLPEASQLLQAECRAASAEARKVKMLVLKAIDSARRVLNSRRSW